MGQKKDGNPIVSLFLLTWSFHDIRLVSAFHPLTPRVLSRVQAGISHGSTTGTPGSLGSDAHVVVQGKLVTVKHGGPRKAIRAHGALAPLFDLLAERSARIDGSLQTNRGKERAQEELGVFMALDFDQWHPRVGVSDGFLKGVMVEQVGQSHLVVANLVAERQVGRDGDTGGLVVPAQDRPVGKVGPALIAAEQGQQEQELHVCRLVQRQTRRLGLARELDGWTRRRRLSPRSIRPASAAASAPTSSSNGRGRVPMPLNEERKEEESG